MAAPPVAAAAVAAPSDPDGSAPTAEKWQAVYTILEAFGNSATSMNTNASRFSHVVSLDFDQAGQVASASIQVRIPRERSPVPVLDPDQVLDLILTRCCLPDDAAGEAEGEPTAGS